MNIRAIIMGLSATIGMVLAAELPEFTLTDHIGRTWEHELVEYQLEPAAAEAVAGRALRDSDGNEILYQLDLETGSIAFQADLKPYATSRYGFTEEQATPQTDLTVTETDTTIELANSHTGIRLLKALPADPQQGPLLGWKLISGSWVGNTRFTEPEELVACVGTVVERGPLRVKAVTRLQFANGDTWTITCELLAHEPVVTVHEVFDCAKRRDIRFVFNDSPDFQPAYALMRASSRHEIDGEKTHDGNYLLRDLAQTEEVLLLEPWVRWGGFPARVSSFSLVEKDWRASFLMAATAPAAWVDPELSPNQRADISSWLKRTEDGRLVMTWQLAKGQRHYLIGSATGDADRDNWEAGRRVPIQAQVQQMRYSDFPLNRVKDYVLAWETPPQSSLPFLSEADQHLLMRDYEITPQALDRLRRLTASISNTEELIPAYLATGDKELERKLIDLVITNVQVRLDQLSKLEEEVVTLNYAPHHYRGFITTCNVLSLVYDSPNLTAEERTRLQGHLAFLAYIFNRDAFCSPAHGFAGFPNMTACVYGVRAALAGVLGGHPEQDHWLQKSTHDLRETFLDTWADEDGNFRGDQLESLDYQHLIYDIVLGVAYRAYVSGADTESLFHPGIRNLAIWWAHSATPRDSRIRDWRHTPPVGHVYKFSATPGLFAIIAHLYRDHDPEFAGWMKWMQLQQGNEFHQAVGGFVPAFAGYRKLFMANDVEPVVPTFTSRHWTGTSLILRNHYNTPYETMLYLIAGDGHSHYDMDSGSITLWGRGEIIADDFGYTGYAPGADHSMLDSPLAPAKHLMHVRDFSQGDLVDYVRGQKMAWTRRAMLVKHPLPNGPNYFVIQDAMLGSAAADWRLWLTGEAVDVDGRSATLTGRERLAADIRFAALPPGATVTTEEKTREPYGLNSDGQYRGRVPTTQHGIVMHSPDFRRLLTLVFPRDKDEPAPAIEAIAGGHGFKVDTAAGTDYVFLSDEQLDVREGELTFQGTAGFARVVDGKAVLTLLEAGEIAYGDQRLIKDGPVSGAQQGNLIPDGRLRQGGFSIFPEQPPGRPFTVELLPTSPELAQLGLQDDFCQKITCLDQDAAKWRRSLLLTHGTLYVDPGTAYRVRARVHIPGDNRVFLSSHALDAAGKQLKAAEGTAWAWSLAMAGPTEGFTEFETTIGADGTEHRLPADARALSGISIRVYDQGDGVFYIDDLVIEEVP